MLMVLSDNPDVGVSSNSGGLQVCFLRHSLTRVMALGSVVLNLAPQLQVSEITPKGYQLPVAPL